MPVRMELSRILIRELNDYQLIVLREVAPVTAGDTASGLADDLDPDGTKVGAYSQVEGGRAFPIVIGLPEAYAIERKLKGERTSRPMTHDLLANTVTALGGVLESITINDLVDSTFYAQLNVRVGGPAGVGKLINIDSRPSDAIALGIGGGVPIYVAEHVLESAQSDEDEEK